MSRTLPTRRAAAPPARAGPASTQELGKAPTVGENHKRSINDFPREWHSHFAVLSFFLLSCVFLHFQVQFEVWCLSPQAQCCGGRRSCSVTHSSHPTPSSSTPFSSLVSPTCLGQRGVRFQSPQGRGLGLCPERILSVLWFFSKRTLPCPRPGKATHLGTG